MDLLRGWIGPRVYQALTEALNWKAQGSPPTNHDGEEFTFEDDGNSLRVRSSKREFVQISKIEEYAKPIQLWLSDTKTFLKVIISASAAERFEREEERRVTEGTLGAVIQILDYEIVAQHHGPKRTKITMLINNFKHIGSDGSGSFGTPCSIECLQPISQVLEKLQTLRTQEHQTSQSPASLKPERDPMSQSHSICSVDDNADWTPDIFATQVPQLQSRKRLREGSLESNNDQPRVLDSSDSGRIKNMIHGGKDTDRGLNLSLAPAYGMKEVSRTNARQVMSKQPKIHDQVTAHDKDVHHGRSREESEAETIGVVKGSAAKRANDLLSLLARNSNKAKSVHVDQPVVVRPAAVAKQSPQDPVPSPPAAAKEPFPEDSDLHRTTCATVRDSDPSSDRPKSPVKSSRVTKPARRPLKASQGPNSHARHLLKTPTRISGREVKISKLQRELLDRAESWYPPEPGHRVPTANVPILVLQELSNGAEQEVGLHHQSSQVSNVSECSGSEDNDQEGFGSDEPIPSAEWPPSSPEQVVLPPDSVPSSARSPEHNISKHDSASDFDLNVISSVEEDFTDLKRRLSSVSLSSSSDMPPRRNLSRAVRLKSISTTGAYQSSPSSQDRSPLSDQSGRRNSLRSAKRYDRSDDHSSRAPSRLQSRSSESRRKSTSASDTPAKSLRGLTRQEILSDRESIAKERSRLSTQDETTYLAKPNQFSNDDRSSQAKLSPKPPPNTDTTESELLTDHHFEAPQSKAFDDHSNTSNLINADSRMSESRKVAFNDVTLQSSSHSNEKVDDSTPSLQNSNPIENSLTVQTSPKDKWPGILSLESIQDSEIQSGPRNDAISSDTESDLETSIPYGLDNTKDISSTIPSTHGFNFKAAQPQHPILQLNRTPYPTNNSLNSPLSSASPTKAKGGHTHSASLDVIDAEGSQVLNATSDVGSAGEVPNPQTVDSHHNSFQGDRMGEGGSPRPPKAKGSLTLNHDVAMVDTPVTSIEETVIAAPTSVDFPKLSENSVLRPSVKVRSKMELKRKASDPVILSPNVTKRSKAFDKDRAASEIGARNQNPDEANIMGFRLRDEFFNTLRRPSDAQTKIEGTGANSTSSNFTKPSLTASLGDLKESLPEKESDLLATKIPIAVNAKNKNLQFLRDHRPTTRQHPTPVESSSSAQPIDIVNETRFEDSTAGDSKLSSMSTRDGLPSGVNGFPSIQVSSTALSLEAPDAAKALHVPLPKPSKNTIAEWSSNAEDSRQQDSIPEITEGGNLGEVTTKLVPSMAQPMGKPEPHLNGSTEGVPQAGQEANLLEDALPQPVHPPSTFERFKATFPGYTGNSTQFTAICKRIGTLFRADRMEHPSLWDDFIVRHRLEYPQYLSRCNDEAVDPIAYERYYRNEVIQAKYINSHGPPVVTPSSIREYLTSETPAHSLSEGSVTTSSEHHRHNGWPQSRLTEDRAQLAGSDKTSAIQSPAISGRAMSEDMNVDAEIPLKDGTDLQSCCCICQQRSSAGMITCANTRCKFKSFHQACINLKETPASGWVYSKCRQDDSSGNTHRSEKQSKHDNRQTSVSDSTTTAHEQEVPTSAVRGKGLLRTESSFVISSRPNQKSDPPNAPKSQIRKEVIDLSSGSEVEEVPDKPKPVRKVPKGKQARRSLPWQSPGRDSNGRAPAGQITASSLASPAPTLRGVSKTSVSRDTRLKNAAAIQDAATAKTVPAIHSSPIKDAKAKPGTSSNRIDMSKDPHSPYNTFVRNYTAITPGKGNSYAEGDQNQRNSSGKKKRKPVDPFQWEI